MCGSNFKGNSGLSTSRAPAEQQSSVPFLGVTLCGQAIRAIALQPPSIVPAKRQSAARDSAEKNKNDAFTGAFRPLAPNRVRAAPLPIGHAGSKSLRLEVALRRRCGARANRCVGFSGALAPKALRLILLRSCFMWQLQMAIAETRAICPQLKLFTLRRLFVLAAELYTQPTGFWQRISSKRLGSV